MAICLYKLFNQVSVINPLLKQSRQLAIPASMGKHQINLKAKRRVGPISKAVLLNTETPAFAQNIAALSNSTVNFTHTSTPNQPSNDGGANEEQLSIIYETLRDDLPQLFVTSLDYSKVHKDIVFENRIRGKTYYGILDYVKQMSFLRLYGHFKYAYVKLDVIKMTQHIEDSSIKVRWRISGITGYRIAFKMLQFRVWDVKQMIEQHQSPWIDGFSTFYVNSDGFIIRHIADKVMPDEDKEPNIIEKVVDKLGQVPKLALVVKLSSDIAPSIV